LGCKAIDPFPDDFTGPRWTASYADHLAWCQAQTDDWLGQRTIQDEENARISDLLACQSCRGVNAAKQPEEATRLHCGFTGNEWSTDPMAQMKTCYAQKGFIWPFDAQQNADRDARLRVCKHTRVKVTPRLGGVQKPALRQATAARRA
jgi:hypothetical protein